MSNKAVVLQHLDTLQIPYALYEHPAAFTMEECYALPFAGPEVTFCKNLLLCNRQQTAFYLLVISPDSHFRTAELSHELGVSRLSFAPEDALPRLRSTAAAAITARAAAARITSFFPGSFLFSGAPAAGAFSSPGAVGPKVSGSRLRFSSMYVSSIVPAGLPLTAKFPVEFP